MSDVKIVSLGIRKIHRKSETDRAPVKTHYLTGRHISFAITSLPVPFSPVMRTEASVGAIFETVVIPGLHYKIKGSPFHPFHGKLDVGISGEKNDLDVREKTFDLREPEKAFLPGVDVPDSAYKFLRGWNEFHRQYFSFPFMHIPLKFRKSRKPQQK